MSNLINKENYSVDAELEKLFANTTATKVAITLPSKGKFYKNFKGASVSPLLYEDEQRILLSKNANIDPINEIISKCVEGVDVDDLVQMDKIFLLLKIKELSYGPEYRFSIVCRACGSDGDIKIDVSEHIKINYAPDDLTDPREITLPVLNAKVKIRFPRNNEMNYLSSWEDSYNNTYRFVVSINDITDPIFISKAVQKMHIRDRKILINEINKETLGIDPTFNFECGHCGHKAVMGVPFSPSFFSVS